MKTILSSLLAALVFSAAAAAAGPKEVLAAYDKVSQALASDDLAAAKKAAAELKAQAAENPALAQHAETLAASDSLKTAREHLKPVSNEAIKLAQGQPGFFVMTCPMAKADWVQTNKQVRNPYMGKAMLECGGMKK